MAILNATRNATAGGLILLAAVSAWSAGQEKVASVPATQVTLTRRSNDPKAPYGTAVYSFRLQTQDQEIHRSYVDLLYGNCGLLHTRMVDQQANRFTDLGEHTLVGAPHQVPADAAWFDGGVTPAVGHVYLIEIAENTERMAVKFRVEAADERQVSITWSTVTPLTGKVDRSRWGHAGQSGFCTPGHPPGIRNSRGAAGPASAGGMP